MNFHQWKSRMRNLQIQTGPAFEDVLLRHFQQCENEVKRNPTLPNGKTPDFLVTDANGATCYVEAKFFMPPRDKAQYARITTPSASLPRVKPHTSTVSIWFCRVDMLELTASILGGKPPVYG